MMPEQSTKPSKQFIKRGIVAIVVLSIILVAQTNWFQKILTNKKQSPAVASVTVGEIVGKDTNGNTIPDWEEKLWGLDPTTLYTNGTSNVEIINAKKKSLGITDMSAEPLDDTDRLARELFTLTAALGQSDEVDSQTLQDIAAKLGSSVDIKQVNNQYSLKDIQTTQTSIASLTTYRNALQKVLATYDTNTPDIEVLATALQNEDPGNLPQLATSTVTYKKLAKDLSAIKVPVGLAQDHLAIMNGFAGIATSFTYMTELNNNSIVALVGVAIYKNYSLRLNEALDNMNDYLTRYGILQ